MRSVFLDCVVTLETLFNLQFLSSSLLIFNPQCVIIKIVLYLWFTLMFIVDSKNMFRRKTPFLLHCHSMMNCIKRCKSWLLYYVSTSITLQSLSHLLYFNFLMDDATLAQCLPQSGCVGSVAILLHFSLYTESRTFVIRQACCLRNSIRSWMPLLISTLLQNLYDINVHVFSIDNIHDTLGFFCFLICLVLNLTGYRGHVYSS